MLRNVRQDLASSDKGPGRRRTVSPQLSTILREDAQSDAKVARNRQKPEKPEKPMDKRSQRSQRSQSRLREAKVAHG